MNDTIQSKIMAMVFAMAAEIERDLISQRTKEASASKSVGQSNHILMLSIQQPSTELSNILKNCTENNLPHTFDAFQQPIINLVEKILSLKSENPQADTQVFEDYIDELVFGLYGFSEEERAVVLGR